MKYPIGIQSFEEIIREGFVYVDKTDLLYKLVQSGKIYFLSRPRRFGKSLFVSTLKNYFLGNKELFKGLLIDKMETEWAKHPVFHIDFNGSNFIKDGTLWMKLEGQVKEWERMYGKHPDSENIGDRFVYVLRQSHLQTGQRAVVLVDEYDKPILDVLDVNEYGIRNGEKVLLENIHRDILQGFYSVFKAADSDLKFVLLTGVTKFSQVSVFSGFNQPADISMDVRYETLCGITEKELYRDFADSIRELAENNELTEEEVKQILKRQYDGYHFSKRMTDIYNPFSLLNCFASFDIGDYWFRTGTPTYLVRLLAHTQENINELINKYYATEDFIDYKADVERPLPMIYQSGYLTIKGYNKDLNTYLLDFPNNEVKRGFVTMVTADYLAPREKNIGTWTTEVVYALRVGDTERFHKLLTAILAETTYRVRSKKGEVERERFFQYTFYLLMKMISCYTVYIEKEQSEGRVDYIVETPKYVYILEFKRDGSAKEALEQIDEKGYAKSYAADNRKLLRIGVSFSSKTGTIEDFRVE